MPKIKLKCPKFRNTLINQLNREYKELKFELFKNNDNKNIIKIKRFNQLFQYFYIEFRTSNFINPLNELIRQKKEILINALIDRSKNCKNETLSLKYFSVANRLIDDKENL